MNRACHHRHVCTVQKHTPFHVSMNIAYHHLHVCTARKHSPISVCCRTPSPIWLRCRCFQLPPRPTLERHLAAWCACHEPAHLVLGEVLLQGSWTSQGPMCPAPWVAQGPVSVTLVSWLCSVTMVALLWLLVPLWHGWLSSLLPVWGGVDPMWWYWVTWCGCPAVPGDAAGVFPIVAPRLPW